MKIDEHNRKHLGPDRNDRFFNRWMEDRNRVNFLYDVWDRLSARDRIFWILFSLFFVIAAWIWYVALRP